MKKKKIGLCGNLGPNSNISNGQIIKTRIISDELKRYYKDGYLKPVNTWLWKSKPIRTLFGCLYLLFKCSDIVILPARGGIKIILPLFSIGARLFNKRIHYIAVGGWLPSFIRNRKFLKRQTSKIFRIYVQTESMVENLKELGIMNSIYLPNFKRLHRIKEEDLLTEFIEPYPLCTFSRIIREKGILDAIKAVEYTNKISGKTIYTLDIYGDIEKEFEIEFNKALEESSDSIKYKGYVEFNQSNNVLKNYFALLFPTYYSGEGFPGTLIDSFAAGLPIIATDWLYNKELIQEGYNGLLYILEKEKHKGLADVLLYAHKNREVLISMRRNCLRESMKNIPENVMKVLINGINKK